MKKTVIKLLQIAVVLFLLLFLVLEAFEISFFVKGDVIVIYTAVVTTLCWLLLGWLFIPYKKLHYGFMIAVTAVFAYLYFFQGEITSAHTKQKYIESGVEE